MINVNSSEGPLLSSAGRAAQRPPSGQSLERGGSEYQPSGFGAGSAGIPWARIHQLFPPVFRLLSLCGLGLDVDAELLRGADAALVVAAADVGQVLRDAE